MDDFETELLKEIETAGKHIYRYWQLTLKYDIDFGGNGVEDFLKDNKKAVKWFCGSIFFRGRDDLLSENYRRAFFKAFDQTFVSGIGSLQIRESTDVLIERFRNNVHAITGKSGRSYRINPNDEIAIRSALEFVSRELGGYNCNPVCYLRDKIKKHEISDFFEKVQISQASRKLKSLMSRDITAWYRLQLNKEELQFAFPIDVWVRKFCALVCPQTNDMPEEQLAHYMTNLLGLKGVAPIFFNAGLWAIGWHGRGAIELLFEKAGVVSSSNQQLQPMIPMVQAREKCASSMQDRRASEKRRLELDGKHAVMEKLRSIGYAASMTEGHHPKILVENPKNGKSTKVWVKTTRDRNLVPIGKYNRDQLRKKLVLPAVFVQVCQDGTKKFYVIPAKDLLPLVEKGYDWWLKEVKHRKKNLAPFDEQSQGIMFRYLQEYENKWGNLGLN